MRRTVGFPAKPDRFRLYAKIRGGGWSKKHRFVSVEISRGKNRGEDVTTGCKKLRHAREHLSLDFFHSRNPRDRDNLKRDRNAIFFFETSFLFFSLLYRREEFISLFLESRNPLKKL